jgi:hypothetical protein
MSDAERAVAAAREEGKREAQAEAARKLAAAHFLHLATGRLADPDKALLMLDMERLVKDGEPDMRAIRALVEQLAPVPPPPPPGGRVPAGPRATAPAPEGGDWLRVAAAQARRR